MKDLILAVLNLINSLIPKGKTVIFNSFPDLEGNTLALFEYILKEHRELILDGRIVWSINGRNTREAGARIAKLAGGIKMPVVRKLSVTGILTYLTASKIITTHNYITGLHTAKGQKLYQLIHGMPYKAGGNLIRNANDKDGVEADVMIADSEYFKEILSKVADIKEDDIYVTGLPADDKVLHPDNALHKLGIDKDRYNRVLLWSPTYRRSDVGSIRYDGSKDAFGIDKILSDKAYIGESGPGAKSKALLDDELRKLGFLLIVKFHPMDALRNSDLTGSDNMIIVSDEMMKKARVTFNELMGDCDVFITDYSSAFHTFMITKRPVAFVADDMEEYASNRGFAMEDPASLMAGERISDMKELLNYLENMDEINLKWRDRYKEVLALMHKYTDGRSSERVYNIIFKK